jgi:hypothetical protein
LYKEEEYKMNKVFEMAEVDLKEDRNLQYITRQLSDLHRAFCYLDNSMYEVTETMRDLKFFIEGIQDGTRE